MAFEYTIDENFNYIIEEKGNSFVALRKIKWGNKDEYKLDIRKYYNSASGEETMAKGLSFLTEEGPGELAKVLLETGYGNAEDIAEVIKNNREDILLQLSKSLITEEEILNKLKDTKNDEEDYYDPRELFDDEQ